MKKQKKKKKKKKTKPSFLSPKSAELVLVRAGVSVLTWQGRHRDQAGGIPRARLMPCTPGVLTSVISPNTGNSTA